MRNKTVTLMAVLTVFLLAITAFAPVTHGAPREGEDETSRYGDREYKFVIGMVNEDEGWRLILNESERVLITSDTEFFNAREKEIGRAAIRSGSWIYTEGPIGTDGAIEAEKIYLLPGHLKSSEYRKYPFINIAPVPWRQ